MFEHPLYAILFSIATVIAALTGFDFVVYVIKSAPKSSYFSKAVWGLGLTCAIGLIFYYVYL